VRVRRNPLGLLGSVLSGGRSGVCSKRSVEEGELGESAAEGNVEDGAFGGPKFLLSGLDSE
jgi:hypothetical protein